MSEFGDLEDVVFGLCRVFLSLLFVVVCGGALTVRCSHIDCPAMFAGSGSISGHTSCPALAITRGHSVRVLQGFVFDVWIGV